MEALESPCSWFKGALLTHGKGHGRVLGMVSPFPLGTRSSHFSVGESLLAPGEAVRGGPPSAPHPTSSQVSLQRAPRELAERPYRTVTSVDVVPIGLVRAITRSPLRL